MYHSNFHDEVSIVPYQEEWAHRFHEIKEIIIARLLSADIECDVRHVGGTAIHGMCGKPIVDVLVLVAPDDLEKAARTLTETIQCLGECGRPGRYFFSYGDGEDDAVYIHLTTPENKLAKDQLAFLKLLQSSPELRERYASLKMQLAEKYPHDRFCYRMEKGAFIQNCLRSELVGGEAAARSAMIPRWSPGPMQTC